MSVPLDQPVRLSFTTYSDAADTTPADPTAITLTVLDPASATTTHNWPGDIVRDSLGVFHFDVTPAAAGHYAFHWKATGAVVTALDGSFDVDAIYTNVTVSVADFKNFIDDQNANTARVDMILRYATMLCESIVNPLPPGAAVVILDVAQRAYAVPPEGVGPYATISPGTMGAGGLFLTQDNKATLRRLTGGGGAFTIDTLPATYTPSLPAWDLGVVSSGVVGDWDSPPL